MKLQILRELALAVAGWGNCNMAWLDNSEDNPAAVVGHINEDGEAYPVATVNCDQYYAGEDSLKLAKFYAAFNPADSLAFLESYEELLAALKRIEEYGHGIGHGSGYTCANIAEQAITNAEKLNHE